MLILGLVLVLAGALLIVAALGTASGEVELLGTDVGALTLFLLGVAAVARQLRVQLILIGVAMAIYVVALGMTFQVPFIPWQ